MRKTRLLVGVGVGAAAMYFFDPDRGRSRRARWLDQQRSRMHKAQRKAQRHERDLENRAAGERARARGAGQFHPTDDRSIELHLHQLLAELDADTSDVTVEAHQGWARLRGQVASPADMYAIVEAARRCPGVEQVESLLHLPGEPAPNKAAALQATNANSGANSN